MRETKRNLWGLPLKFSPMHCWVVLLFALMSLSSINANADDAGNTEEEVPMLLTIQGVGSLEISAIIRGRNVFLSVTDIFTYLKIRNQLSPDIDTISGFYIHEDAPFVIDKVNNKIFLGQQQFELKAEDLIKTGTSLYLKMPYWGQIFGLNASFNFRSLSVNMTTQLEMPVIREMRLEQMRKNINKLKGSLIVDTTFSQSYPLFNFGVVDWSVISTQQEQGQDQTMVNLNLGSVIAGGETNISINYNSTRAFKEIDQYYLWRYTNNNKKELSQLLLGKIRSFSTSSIFSPVVGFQFTNAPTTTRQSFGSYTLSNTAQPGEVVELYVNNVLVDYVKTDASGQYNFQVPLVYGTSEIKTKFYGPWGEERVKQEHVIIPFNFLPEGLFEYTVSGGIVEDKVNSKYTRGHFNYGVTRGWTIGGGIEYLSSVTSGNTMPFVNTSMILGQGLIMSGEYTHGVRSKGTLNYRWPSNTQLELTYAKYAPGQRAVNVNFLEERKFTFSTPIRGRHISLFTRITANQFVLPTTEYTTAEWLISGAFMGMGAHISTYALYASAKPYIYSNASLTFRLPKSLVFTPEAQYEFNNQKFISMRWRLEKCFFKSGYIGLYYEQNFKTPYNNIGVDLRYDFSFAQLGLTSRRINNQNFFLQSARGSVQCDPRGGYAGFNSRSSLGKGNIEIVPFLDLNDNGVKDKHEPKVSGLKILSSGGRMDFCKKDTCIRIFDLEPYTNYFVELDDSGLDNISWRLKKKSINIVIEPNKFKKIPVPISVLAEVSGNIYLNGQNVTKGQGQIIVSFYKDDTTLVGKTMSESDGYFNFLGLPYGKYTVRVDSIQMHKLNMKSIPIYRSIFVSQRKEGDLIEHIDFTLEAIKPE